MAKSHVSLIISGHETLSRSKWFGIYGQKTQHRGSMKIMLDLYCRSHKNLVCLICNPYNYLNR